MKTPLAFLVLSVIAITRCAGDVGQPAAPHKIAPGPFQADWPSLAAHYQCPEWFRDAKFGIWAHWTAQCVPEQGDWYARLMYIQGTPQYEYHVKHYGHPSKFGFMELDHLWTAKNWDPEKLMDLYVKAGAKYFVALANHHDNFDNYDSKYHAWNSVNVGPHKDIVGTWEKVAREHGLHFGVSNHSAHAWHWFQTAYGYDGEGPLAGVRYDAATLTKADGKGKWWEGLDPQDLYTGPNMEMPAGIHGAAAVQAWHEAHDRVWTEKPPANNPAFTENWYLRCKDLIDHYHPDLIYFDDIGDLPLGQAGLDIAAHYYNSSLTWNGGRLESVINVKGLDAARRPGVVEDYERGASDEIQPLPWQTDTCIGDWHYNRAVFEQHRYKTVKQVTQMLVNVVSKNGNLLLSIPIRGDGTIDSDEQAFLKGMAAWMAVNGEGIFGTRPWKVAGEGPSKAVGGMFNENAASYSPQDIRFTTEDGVLYAFLMEWPGAGTTVIRSLAGKTGKILSVSLLGYPASLSWTQDDAGLHVVTPAKAPTVGPVALRIAFAPSS